MKFKFVVTLVFLVSISSCSSMGDKYVKKKGVLLESGQVKTGIKSLVARSTLGYDCCFEISKEIRGVEKGKPTLMLTHSRGTLPIPISSAASFANYLSKLHRLKPGGSKQQGLKIGGNTWRVGSRLEEGKQITFVLDLRSIFVFKNEDLPEVIALIQGFENKFAKLEPQK